jgi:hypothetical protein
MRHRLGWRVSPAVVLVIALAGGSWLAWTLWRRAAPSRSSGAAASTVVGGTTLFFLAIATPDWLPVGGGPDLTHHLVLINYISRAWKLVDDPALYPFLGDMMDYPEEPPADRACRCVGACRSAARRPSCPRGHGRPEGRLPSSSSHAGSLSAASVDR